LKHLRIFLVISQFNYFRYNTFVMNTLNKAFSGTFATLAVFLLVLLTFEFADAQTGVKEAEFKSPNWEHNLVINFGIYDQSLERIGSAAYKIELNPEMGINNYTIKYNAKSADMSEASTCLVDKKTLLPSRSTRKLVNRGSTWYQNASYAADGVTVTSKRDEGAIIEQKLPVGAEDKHYDFEETLMIIPQINWTDTSKVYFYLFRASAGATSWVVVEDQGDSTISWKDKIWKCRKLHIKCDFGEQYMYTTIVDGRTVIAKYDMGAYSFINLDIPSTGTVVDLKGEVSLETAFEMTK
jgi:hypothetical protein